MPEKLIGDVASGWPGVIAGLASGVGSLAIFMWRTKRGDARQDEVANQFGEMVEIMRGLAQSQQDRADQQSRRADDFAKERNELQHKMGRLEAQVEFYEGKAEHLHCLLGTEKETVRAMADLCRHLLKQCPGRLEGVDMPKGVAMALLDTERESVNG